MALTIAERAKRYRDKKRGGPPGSKRPPGRRRTGMALGNAERQKRHRDKARGGPPGGHPGRPRIPIGTLIHTRSWRTWSGRRKALRLAEEGWRRVIKPSNKL
jgi:hypothetical protein